MSRLLAPLSPAQLEAVADAVARGPISDPGSGTLSRILGAQATPPIVSELQGLRISYGEQVVVAVLRAVAAERRIGASESDRRLELVWTGPERDGAGTRDTAVVVRELLSRAEREVLLSGYAVFGGKEIFAPIAERRLTIPALRVRLFLNVRRDKNDQRSQADIVGAFRRDFLRYDWPEATAPDLYFDPRALAPEPEERAVLHAKCVVVDDRRALVTSANLTEAAQSRNIEAGVLIEDKLFARSLRLQFDDLVERGLLLPLVV